MSDLEKAARDAVEAADNTRQVELIAAVLQAQQLLAQQQPAPACQHQARPGRSAGEWLGIGGAVCVGGVGLAIGFIAIAIGSVSVAILALVLRSMWADVQRKGR
ncbi:hypothetical protein [Streptomyces sp. SLBN-134]|uniref:hypothetical protein n=1 Tax=Streptomyces sp. SLBN-134 TaxID=2768456 RepID=UPI001154884E|nr:hypothetical protein [Streptomyces sp. SLBN-134]TQL21952.1 hypothetical protein FBY37_3969 [Streptomyces sp. SLBN-134]